MASLLDIPKDVFTQELLPYLRFEDRAALRQVSSAFRELPEDENQKQEFIRLLQYVEKRELGYEDDNQLNIAIVEKGNKVLIGMLKAKQYPRGFPKRHFVAEAFVIDNLDYFDLEAVCLFKDLTLRTASLLVNAINRAHWSAFEAMGSKTEMNERKRYRLLKSLFETQKVLWDQVRLIDLMVKETSLSGFFTVGILHRIPCSYLMVVLVNMKNKHKLDWKFLSSTVEFSRDALFVLKDYVDFKLVLIDQPDILTHQFIENNWHLFRDWSHERLIRAGFDPRIATRNKKRKLN